MKTLFGILFIGWFGLCCSAAQALEVRVEAPRELAELLQTHLEIARAARAAEPVSADELARLQSASLATARELLATEGYFSPQIDESVTQGATGPVVRYRVQPGPRTQVGSVSVTFRGGANEATAARARLRTRIERNFALKPGMPFRQADWDQAKRGVLTPLLSSSFPAARLADSMARIDPQQRTAALSVQIDSGPVFYYGDIAASGTARYPAKIIQNLSPFKRGAPYRQQDLLDYQAALETSGYFAQALVTIDPDPAQAAAVPVKVVVVERPDKQVSFGVGASTDTGARVQAEFLHRNLLERGLRMTLNTRLETRQQQSGVDFALPQNARGFNDSLGLRLKRTDIEGQVTDSLLLAGTRSRTRGMIDTALTVQFQVEDQKLANVVTDRNQALSANYSWTQRTTRRALYPRSGYVLNAQLGGAAEALLSDQSFIRLYGRHTQYFRAGQQGRLILRGELGGVIADSRDGIPTDFLFRAGGDNSVRGYAYQSLGLRTADVVEPVRYLATGSVEYNYFFNRTWGMALFVDAGDAADALADLSPVVGVGTGVRYRSPVGPLNLDIAYGEATQKLRLHFSLGVSF